MKYSENILNVAETALITKDFESILGLNLNL